MGDHNSFGLFFFFHQNTINVSKSVSEKSEVNELFMPVTLASTFLRALRPRVRNAFMRQEVYNFYCILHFR